MEVTVEIVEDDIVHFNEYMRRRKVGLRDKPRYPWMIVSLLVGAMGFFAYSNRGHWQSLLFIPLAAVLVTFPWLSRISLRRAVRRAMKENNRVPIGGQRRIELTSEEIRIDSAYGYSGWKWSAIEAIDVDDRMLMFLISSIQGVLVPRRAFADEGEFDTFVATAQRFWEDGR